MRGRDHLLLCSPYTNFLFEIWYQSNVFEVWYFLPLFLLSKIVPFFSFLSFLFPPLKVTSESAILLPRRDWWYG